MGWYYLLMLSQSDRDTAMQLLFGTNGCRFALGRIPMGASDYAMDRYTLDEVPSGSTDLSMSSFSIARDEEKLIPIVQKTWKKMTSKAHEVALQLDYAPEDLAVIQAALKSA